MNNIYISGISVLIQCVAAFLSWRLIRVTGWRHAWFLISAAVSLTGASFFMKFIWLIAGRLPYPPDLLSEWAGLATSVLMLSGVMMIAPIFRNNKHSADVLRDSEEKYRSLVESSEDSIYLIDREYKYLFMNKQHLSRMGFPLEYCIGKPYGGFHSPEETKEFIEKVDEVFRTGASLLYEHNSLRDNRYFLRTLSPVKESDGTTVAVTVVSKNITIRKQMEDELRSLSLTDDLTGLNNRRGFLTMAEQQLRIANRNKSKIFIFFADLDGLKTINDIFGHHEGNLALIETAHILRESFRETDIIARIGGDEFVVLVIDNSVYSSEMISVRLQKNLEIHNSKKGRGYRLSMSFGVSACSPDCSYTVDDLLAQADKMMYRQKKSKQQII